ncbi:MAG TPA: sigma-70 family RNA polymerase sigma factor [Niastella sp.]
MDIANDILVRLNNNEPAAERDLFNAAFAPLMAFAYKMTEDEAESKDIAIKAITKLYGRTNIFTAVEQLRSYLYISVRNSAINYLKKINRADPYKRQLQAEMPVSEEPTINKKFEFEHLRNLIEAVLPRLEKQVAAVIKLTLDGMETKEIAEALNIPATQVYTQRSKGIKLLKEFLAENGSKYGIPIVIILLALLCRLCFG